MVVIKLKELLMGFRRNISMFLEIENAIGFSNYIFLCMEEV